MTPRDYSKTDLRRGRIRPQPTDRDHATSAEEEALLLEAVPEEGATGGKDRENEAVTVNTRKKA